MNKLIAISAMLAGASACFGQATVIEFGPGAQATIDNNHTAVKNSLDKLLETANKQLENLDKQLQRTGDYLAANRASVTDAQAAMQSGGVTSVKTNAELAAMRADAKGADVFDSSKDVEGVFKAVSTKYKAKVKGPNGNYMKNADGSYVEEERDRDPNEYDLEAKRIADLREFYRVRDESITKQKALEQARLDAHADLLKTEDAVETQRLTSLLSSIDAELIAVRQDMANASQELEMHEKALALQQTVEAKAKREELRRKSSSPEDIQKMIDDMKENVKKDLKDRARGRLP